MKITHDTIKVKVNGRTYTVRPNAWGNWYGYEGNKNVALFFGNYDEQRDDAAQWLVTLIQSAALATLKAHKPTHSTLKAVKAVLAINRVSIHKICGEYKVYPKGTIGQAYFTDDLFDALGTGLQIAKQQGTLTGPHGETL